MKIPKFEAQTEWVKPTEFPDLRQVDEIAIDLETHDPDLKSMGSGSVTKKGKVVGIAGSDTKCKKVVEELGFDGCIDYKNANLVRDLKTHCPEGIELYFDNVGGTVLEAVLIRMKNRGRVVCCGAVSQYESSSPIGPRNIPGFVITKRLRWEGFIVMDFKEKHMEAITHMTKLLNEGKITIIEDITEGLENAPKALVNLLNGKNFGKSMVRVAPDPYEQKMS